MTIALQYLTIYLCNNLQERVRLRKRKKRKEIKFTNSCIHQKDRI